MGKKRANCENQGLFLGFIYVIRTLLRTNYHFAGRDYQIQSNDTHSCTP